MKNEHPTSFSFAKVFCNLFGHKLRVSKNITNHVHEYRCKNCGMEMTDTADGFLARLTPKFKETNAYLAKIHRKRKEVFSAFDEISLES
jgi:protein-arginine kinase activator protein McsA